MPDVGTYPHAAYIRMGLRLIAQGATLDDLLAALVEASFPADGFRIDFQALSKQVQFSKTAAIAKTHIESLLRSQDKCQMIALADVNPDKAREKADRFELNVAI